MNSISEFSRSIFQNPFVESLPGDTEQENYIRQVSNCFYSNVLPSPVSSPRLVGWSENLAASFNFSYPTTTGDFVQALSGNKIIPSMKPFSARYGGHQFGNWAGQLGDGRAITLGSLASANGSLCEFQLKGAGPTPYSRHADGRAVLRSSMREFLCSEAMHHLGIPTTRALSLIATGDPVRRDMFYDGHAKNEAGAVVCRVAPSFIRFGNFEILADAGESENLRLLLDFTIRSYFPELVSQRTEYSSDRYAAFFSEVARLSAGMIAHWMSVGFVHGVMNTDNMSILGLTIDYGPYGWLEPFTPGWTPNTTDFSQHRYAYGRQPSVGYWNLTKLAEALSLVVTDIKSLEAGLAVYQKTFETQFFSIMTHKFGFGNTVSDETTKLILEFLSIFEELQIDMTIFLRRLPEIFPSSSESTIFAAGIANLLYASYDPNPHESSARRLTDLLSRYLAELRRATEPLSEIRARMLTLNPKFVLRNYLAYEAARDCEAGDSKKFVELYSVLRRPFDEHPELERLAEKRPEWAASTPGSSSLSCSS